MTEPRLFTHVIVYNDGTAPLAVDKDKARRTRRWLRMGGGSRIEGVYTYGEVARQYAAADESATRADKTLRGMWCGGWSEWSAAREELWTDRSNTAHAKLEKWSPLLAALDNAERDVAWC